MEQVISNLHKRRKIMFYIILSLALVAIIVDSVYQIGTTDYFDEQTRFYMVYGLIAYKLIELTILYFFFYRRHMVKYHSTEHDDDLLAKFDKNAKRFLMLVPHGSVIFGVISYKLTTNILFFLLFLTIAFTALSLVKPKKFFDYAKSDKKSD